MKIKILRPVIIKGELFETGRIFDCENFLANELCANYKAEKSVEKSVEITVEVDDDKKKVIKELKTKKRILEKK